MQYPNPLLPVIYGPLRERSTRHWNTTVEGLAHNVLRMYNEQDAAAFERWAWVGGHVFGLVKCRKGTVGVLKMFRAYDSKTLPLEVRWVGCEACV